MNLRELHNKSKGFSAAKFFEGTGTVTAFHIGAGQQLKKHTTSIPALLLCVQGRAVYETEKGLSQTLLPGDYMDVEPEVVHWVNGIEDSQLLLMK